MVGDVQRKHLNTYLLQHTAQGGILLGLQDYEMDDKYVCKTEFGVRERTLTQTMQCAKCRGT